MQLKYIFTPRKIGLILGIISLYLTAQSLLGEYLLENVLSSDVNDSLILLIELSSVNAEETIPTWYATLILFVAAVLLAFIAAAKQVAQDRYRHHWLGLAVIFLYLSMDEGAVIHEILADPLQAMFNTTGYLAFGWQIVAVPLVMIFALFYWRFLFHLPSHIRNYFIVAGLLYVGGAIVVEAISANRWYLDGGITFQYLAIATIEELFEMLGVVVFIFALLSYAVEMRYTAFIGFALSNPTSISGDSGEKSPSLPWIPLTKWAIVFIVGLNLALYAWAFAQQSIYASAPSPPIPFEESISNQYAGQGVIILRINETLGADTPFAQQVATSLLTLFDDVLVVTLPLEQFSIAFASHTLPFDQATVVETLHASGKRQFIIFDTPALEAIAGDTYSPNQ